MELSVISVTRIIPVSGARTTAVNNAAMPTSAKAIAWDAWTCHAEVDKPAEDEPHLRPEDEQRREHAARRSGGIGGGAKKETKHINERKKNEHRLAVESALGECVATSGKVRREPRQRADGRPDQRGAKFHRPAGETIGNHERAEQHVIVNNAKQARDGAQCKAPKIIAEDRIRHIRHGEIRRRAGEEPCHDDGAARSSERGNGVARIEFPGEFLQDEDCPGKWRIERGGKPSTCTRREQRQAVGGVPAKNFPSKFARVAPIWTQGPSRPSAKPAPIASRPPKNLTGSRINGAGGSSPLRTAST